MPNKDYSLKFLVWMITGFIVLFGASFLFRSNGTPFYSLVVALFSGIAGLFVAGQWMAPLRAGGITLAAIVLAFLARISFGVFVYGDLDPSYFSSNGLYRWGHSEIELSYTAARLVYLYLVDNGAFSSTLALGVLNAGDTKNPIIHWWMGFFLASGKSANAMDLAVFNAFHMSLAGMGIISLALQNGYQIKVALRAGIVTAWMPYSFAASVLWRDPVGILFVIVAVVAITRFDIRRPMSWPWLAASFFLSFAHRTVYPVAMLMVNLLNKSNSAGRLGIRGLMGRRLIFLSIATLGVILIMRVFSDYFFLYHSGSALESTIGKVVFLPIFFLRSIAGPFPWLQEFRPETYWISITDIGYHVLQLAVFLVIAKNYKIFFRSPDALSYAFILLYLTAILAPGIHSSYLAVALPFIIPRVLSFTNHFSSYLVKSFCIFIVANCLFYLFGLSGSGLSQSITGY